MWGYVYALADGESVVVLCKDELATEESIARMTFRTGADSDAFYASLSLIRPVYDYAAREIPTSVFVVAD